MNLTKIEWTESTWNPLTGCTKISPGCNNCYAEKLAIRLKAMGNPNYANGFKLTLHEHALNLPLKFNKPKTIFVNSMSDLFHKEVPIEFIKKVFKVMEKAHWHCFQVLTKRSERLIELSREIQWPDNVWMGVSVENNNYTHRIEHLKQVPAKTKFISFEPLLGPIDYISLVGIDWVIVGGESGPKARPMDPLWVKNIRNHCHKEKIPFFFKQWGGIRKNKTGRLLDGRTWDEIPNHNYCAKANVK